MKKNYLLLVALATAIFATSCSDSKDSDNPTMISQENQKNIIEEASVDFLNNYKVKDFNDVYCFIDDYKDLEFSNEDEVDNNENWIKKCTEQLTTTVEKEIKGDNLSYCTNNDYVYMLSNIKKHVTYDKDNKINVITEANDFQYIFTDSKNNECRIVITTSGKTNKFFLNEYNHNTGEPEGYEPEDGEDDLVKEFTEIEKNYVEIPEMINISFTKNGETILDSEIKTNIDSKFVQSSKIFSSTFDFSTKITVNKYAINIEKAAYSPTYASVKFNLSKENKELLSLKVSVNGFLDTILDKDQNVKTFVSLSYDDSDDDSALKLISKGSIELNLMNKVQLKGNIKNPSFIVKYYEGACNTGDMGYFDMCKEYVNKINNNIDIALYYNNKNTKQAEFKFNIMPKDEVYCKPTPIILFENGTTYSLLNTFFNENNFKNLLETYSKIQSDIDDMKDKNNDD